jgi:hypothetical protein
VRWVLGSALMALLMTQGGCNRGLARDHAPDFGGTWDITYDDSMRVELRIGERALRADVPLTGGPVTFADGGTDLAFEVDCTRPELVCPAEVWPRELALETTPGELDGDGVQLTRMLTGEGSGPCAARPGSVLTGEVLATTSESAVSPEAVAVTAGRIRVRVPAACVASGALPPGAEAVLSTGYTAAKR